MLARNFLSVAAVAALVGLITAVPADAARSWRTPLELERNDSINRGAMTPTSSGDVVMAWPEGQYQTSSALKVRAREVGSGALTPTQTIGGNVINTSVAPLGTGAVVAWSGSTAPGVGGTDILVSEYTPGAGFSAPQAVASGYSLAVAGNTAGDAVVVFETGGVLMRVRRAPNGTWGAPAQVSAASGTQISAGMSSTGEAVYTWNTAGGGLQASFETAGGAPSAAEDVTPPGMTAGSATLDVNASGAAVVGFVQQGEFDGVGRPRAAVRPAGGSFGSPADLGGLVFSSDPLPSVISDDGHVASTWFDIAALPGGGYQSRGVAAALGTVSGGFAPREVVAADADISRPLVAIDPVGNTAVFHGEFRSGTPLVARRPVNGGWEAAYPVVPCPGPTAYANGAALDANGNAVLMWTEYDRMTGTSKALFLSQDEASSQASPSPCPSQNVPPPFPGGGTTIPNPPPPPPLPTTPVRPTLALLGPKSVKLKTLLKSGVSVSVKTTTATKVRNRLYLMKGKKRILAGTVTVSAKANRKLVVKLKPSKSAAKQLKKLKKGTLLVESKGLEKDYGSKPVQRKVSFKR